MEISVLADVKPLLGEGPLWDTEGERHFFLDVLGRRVFRCIAEGCEMRPVPALWTADTVVATLADGFHWLHLRAGEVTSMAEPPLPRYPGDGLLRGSLFVIDGLGVTGRPEPRFAG